MSGEEKNRDELSGAGRYDLIEHFTGKGGSARSETAFGTSAVEGKDNLLVSQNLMLEGIDFSLVYFPLKHLGYKLVVRSLAGVFASGGTTTSLSVTIAMSSRFGTKQAEEIFEGITLAAKKYKVEIRYFDFVSSLTGLTLTCTAWGYKESDDIVRTQPSVNDLICVTGDLGAAYIGLQILERERRIFESGASVQPDLSEFEYVISRQLKPELRKEILSELKRSGVVPALTTVVRDGLASEIIGVCKSINMGCRLYYDKIPVDSDTYRSAEEMGIDAVIAALNGGEDYEFLFIAPVTMVESISKQKDVRMIGYLTDSSEGNMLVTPDNEVVELRAQGWKK